jgi:soluble lytic murein transglycosylase
VDLGQSAVCRNKAWFALAATALWCASGVSFASTFLPHAKPKSAANVSQHRSGARKASSKGSSSKTRGKAGRAGAKGVKASHERPLTREERRADAFRKAELTVQSIRLNSAFTASATLRPMAQQLASGRSAAGFAGVSAYATSHPGAAASTAYLAMGHAYALDHRYAEAASAFSAAARAADTLSDYADYLGAQALVNEQQYGDAVPLLEHFGERHPDSIFDVGAPLLLASAYESASNSGAAVRLLEPMLGTTEAEHADFKLALAKGYQGSGQTGKAIALYRSLYVSQPLSAEATQAKAQLVALGSGLSAGERKVHADELFNAKRYSEASAEYTSIRNDPSLSQGDRDALLLYNAVCDLRLKRLSRRDIDKLQATNDDTAALKLYLYAEVSRTEKNRVEHDADIAQMVNQYPHSRWLEEALYSGGNMYLLTHDSTQAIYHYKLLVERFPNSIYAPSSHWRNAWMNYRLRNYPEAARLMDEQVTRYGAGIEASSALYWRARIFEEEEHDFAHAAAYYQSLVANYTNFYYGDLAKKRLVVLGPQTELAPTPALLAVRKLVVPDLTDVVPENDPHYIKAKLLANAALNEYIAPEIAASPGSSEWGALAQAEIYASFGEYTRALQSMKHSGISFFALPTSQVPLAYWKLIFPQPYWNELVSDSEKNGLDPYLVASLIRQESEFNAGAVSPAHAIGLMQLLPSVGKENARKEGLKGFNAGELLNPAINLELGTRNLRQVLDRFGGQPEYALAAYNAGDMPVRQWMAVGDYKDIPEFVESIPYTETREYVQAIMRNRELYHTLYGPR